MPLLSLYLIGCCTALWLFRLLVFDAPQLMLFLPWNLFLAFLPVVFALAIRRLPAGGWLILPLWLLFLPNAPYLVSDLIHIRQREGVSLHFDVLFFFLFAISGLLMGGQAIHLVAIHYQRHLRTLPGRLAFFSLFPLIGLGIFLGRQFRWNSWDVLLHPVQLISELFYVVVHTPPQQEALVMVSGYGLLTFGAYLLVARLQK